MASPGRIDGIDALRGAALLWMAAFHFGFDLHQFGYWQQDYYRDPFWTTQRTVILSLFLFCAGAGQAFAQANGQDWPRFWRRWAQIAGCAVLVTAGSWLMFPRSAIFFGVLHGMAVMLVVARITVGWGRWLWPAGLAALLAVPLARVGLSGSAWEAAFNSPGLAWLGLVTVLPVTEDYVPVLPWLGVLWWGMAAGQWLAPRASARQALPLPGPLQALARLGRWSLRFYMVHQPVLIGLLWLAGWWRG
ncbi:MAG: heparan-alpha-glucosaminide N-acetyltransferase [Rhodoferax sp.]